MVLTSLQIITFSPTQLQEFFIDTLAYRFRVQLPRSIKTAYWTPTLHEKASRIAADRPWAVDLS